MSSGLAIGRRSVAPAAYEGVWLFQLFKAARGPRLKALGLLGALGLAMSGFVAPVASAEEVPDGATPQINLAEAVATPEELQEAKQKAVDSRLESGSGTPLAASASPRAAGTASISGTVTLAAGAPGSVTDVTVEVTDIYGNFVASANPNASGKYTVAGLAEDSYIVGFHPKDGANIVEQWCPGQTAAHYAHTILLTDGEAKTGVDATMVKGATISGKVTLNPSSLGSLENVSILIHSLDTGAFYYDWADASGNYQAVGLPGGYYTVLFSLTTEANPLGEMSQWYDGTEKGVADENDAEWMELNDGGSKTGVNTTFTKILSFTTIPKPVISGDAKVGSTLTATKAAASDFVPKADSVSYQWYRADSVTYQWFADGTEIKNATGATYNVAATDAGKAITVKVTGTKAGYTSASKTSTAVSVAGGSTALAVSRLAGSSRCATNDAVNARFGVKGGPVFVATGVDFADALSIGPVVGITGGTLFLVPGSSVSQGTLNAMKALSPSAVYIVGGKGAVSEAVASKVKSATGKIPVRVAGKSRYQTSEEIYKKFFVETPRAVSTAFVATGRDFPDALSAASAGAALSAPVLLVDGKAGKNLSAYLLSSLAEKGTSSVLISGGKGAVSATIETNLKKTFGTTGVKRLSGPNRYATNAAVNTYLNSRAGSTALTSVWLATGADFPDALSAAAPSGKLSSRLVLSNGSCIPKPVVSEWITKPGSQVSDVYLVGGKGVLRDSVYNLTQCK